MTAPTKRGDTRTKMLVSAAQVMRERGAAGVTIDEVLARSGAPRGSVYYHFPDGRNQILTEALRYSGDSITAMIDDAAGWGARALLREFVEFWLRQLSDGNFTAGCGAGHCRRTRPLPCSIRTRPALSWIRNSGHFWPTPTLTSGKPESPDAR